MDNIQSIQTCFTSSQNKRSRQELLMVFLVSLAKTQTLFFKHTTSSRKNLTTKHFCCWSTSLTERELQMQCTARVEVYTGKARKIESARSYLWVEKSVMLMSVNEYYSETYLVLRRTCTMDLCFAKISGLNHFSLIKNV